MCDYDVACVVVCTSVLLLSNRKNKKKYYNSKIEIYPKLNVILEYHFLSNHLSFKFLSILPKYSSNQGNKYRIIVW